MRRFPIRAGLSIVCVIAWFAPCVAGQATANDLETLKKQRQDLEAQYNRANAQYRVAREEITRQEDMQELYASLNDARALRDKRVRQSPTIAAAYKAMNDAYAAMNQGLEAEVAADKAGAPLLKQIQAVEDQMDEIDAQQRLANFMLSEIRRRSARQPDVNKAMQAMNRAENAVYDATRNDEKIAAAYKAVEEARQVPLSREEIDQAQKAYENAVKNSPAVVAATQARDAARKACEEVIAAKVAAHPDTPDLNKKLADLGQKLKSAQLARKDLAAKLEEVRQAVAKNSTKVAELRKTYYAGDAAYRQAINAEVPNETAAVEDLQRTYYEKLEEKVASDLKTATLRKETEDLYRQMEEVSAQIRKLESARQSAAK